MTTFNEIDGIKAIPAWLKAGLDKHAIDFAEDFGTWLAVNQLTTTQIRNIYGEIKRIQMKDAKDFSNAEALLLKPKLAYARARGTGQKSKVALESLAKIMNAGIDAIFDDSDDVDFGKDEVFKRFENFAMFFEAVIAYHRAKGGK
jgi:CRISPR-associated protein Csm2